MDVGVVDGGGQMEEGEEWGWGLLRLGLCLLEVFYVCGETSTR